MWASVGGTRVIAQDLTLEFAVPGVLPQTIRSGNNSGNLPEAAELFGVWLDDANATSTADGIAKLQTLDFLG